ncbi:hypothetical protein ACM714_20515 [Pseudomonas aeruginosa]
MQESNATPRLFDSEVQNSSEKRLRVLLEANYPRFSALVEFKQKLSETEHAQRKAEGRAGRKVLPATKTIVAATLGCERFKDLANLEIPVDEHLGVTELEQRRAQQASLLSAFISEKSPTLGLVPPSSVDDICREFVDMWQPTARTYDELAQTLHRALQAKIAGELPKWFNRVAPQLEAASYSSEILPKAVVYEALALLKVADEASLTPAIWYQLAWPAMRENLGIAATALANTRELSKSGRATNILQLLWESGILYAGIQLARMHHDLLASNRVNLQRAEQIIDQVLRQYEASPNRSRIFTTAESHADLFQTYNTIKIDALRNAEEPARVLQLTQEILAAGTYASRLGFEGFAACVMSILAPGLPELQSQGNEEIFALREKISGYPEAEAFCRYSAELALANRRR